MNHPQYLPISLQTKKNGNTLMKEFEGVLHHNHHIKNLDAVVGLQ